MPASKNGKKSLAGQSTAGRAVRVVAPGLRRSFPLGGAGLAGLTLTATLLVGCGEPDARPEAMPRTTRPATLLASIRVRVQPLLQAGRRKQAQDLVRDALADENGRNAILLTKAKGRRSMGLADLAGRTAAFVDDRGRLAYWRANGFERFTPPGEILSFHLSPRGERIALLLREPTPNPGAGTAKSKPACVAVVFDPAEESLEGHRYPCDCRGKPGVSDDGARLLLAHKQRLRVYVSRASAGSGVLQLQSEFGPFARKFQRTAAGLYVARVDAQSALFFFGSAGYYDLYAIDMAGGAPLRTVADVTLPTLFSQGAGHTGPAGGQRAPTAPVIATLLGAGPRAGARAPLGYILRGGAGRTQLQVLVAAGNGVLAGWSRPMQYSRDLHVLPSNRLLTLTAGQLRVRATKGGEQKALALLATRVWLFRGGLLYRDSVGRFLLRRRDLTAHERELARYLASPEISAPTGPPR